MLDEYEGFSVLSFFQHPRKLWAGIHPEEFRAGEM